MDTAQTFSARWELEERYQQGTFLITPYKPVYGASLRLVVQSQCGADEIKPDYSWSFDDHLPLNAMEIGQQVGIN